MATRTILFSYAHPDDESFGPGGTIARYSDAGVRIVLVCATLGEAGKAGDPPVCTPDELPQVRKQELMAAAQVLGVHHVELLGYRDKELDQVELEEGISRIEAMLQQYEPESVVTFPPGGISGHPDHLVVQKWTLEAVRRRRAGQSQPVPRLYYTTVPADFFEILGVKPHHPLDVNSNVRIRVSPWLDRKIEALRRHRSQHLSVDPLLAALEEFGREMVAWEHYLHIDPVTGEASPPPHPDSLLDPPIDDSQA